MGIGPAFDVDLGGASSVEVIPFESAHEMANVVDVEFLAEEIPLTACRMLYPGYLVYDIEIPNDIFDYPLDLVFIPYSLIDDIGLPMGAALVTVERPGPATIPIPLRTVFHSPVRSTVAVDEDDVSDFLGQCQSHIVALDESGRGNDFATYLDYEDDPVAVAAFSPLGTYQRLAEEAEWWDLDAPFRVLAYVHGVHGDLFADEIALITSGDRLRWLRERYEAGCYSITTSYESGHVLVQQQSGCEPEPNTTLLQERGQWSLWGYSENPDEISWFANASPRPPEELAPLDR